MKNARSGWFRGGIYFLLALVLAGALSVAGLDTASLSLHDEGRVAGIGREMMDRGSLAVPYLNGRPFLEKPPLYWWVQILSYRTLGISVLSARVASGVFGFLALLCGFALGARLGGARAGLATLIVLGTAAGFADVAHRVIVDSALLFTVALGTLGFVIWLTADTRGGRIRGALIWGVAVPLSFLAKGMVGPAFTAACPVFALFALRRFREGMRAVGVMAAATVAGALLVLPWFLAAAREAGSSAAIELTVGQAFGRALGIGELGSSHAKPIWYYLTSGPGHFLPFLILLPAMVRTGLFRRSPENEAPRALGAMTLAGILVLSLAADKRGIYLAPLMAPFAAFAGPWIADGMRGTWARRSALALLGLVAAVTVLVPLALAGLHLGPDAIAGHSLLPFRVGLPPVSAALVGVISVGVAVLLIRRLRRHLREQSVPGAWWLLVPAALATIAVLGFGKPIRDEAESRKPLTGALARELAADEEVVVFPGRESLTGLIYFELGRHNTIVTEPAKLRFELVRAGARHLLVEGRSDGGLPEDLRPDLEAVFTEALPERDRYVLYRFTDARTGGEEPR